jgi:dimethylglycine dehydrogenase
VRTEKGDILTPWVVNAAGLWGREVAAMAGIELPLIPTEHQYFVTETIPEIAAMDRRLPSVADRDGEYYLRQEGKGLLVGAYERDMRFWAEEGTPQGFGHELFADDLERIEENMMRAIDRVPAVGEAGIKRVINGPMIWSPDASALVRPGAGADGVFLLQRDHPGLFAKRRAGAARRRMDGGGRALARHVRLGPGAVRGLGGQGLYPRAGGRPVRASLQDPFPR